MALYNLLLFFSYRCPLDGRPRFGPRCVFRVWAPTPHTPPPGCQLPPSPHPGATCGAYAVRSHGFIGTFAYIFHRITLFDYHRISAFFVYFVSDTTTASHFTAVCPPVHLLAFFAVAVPRARCRFTIGPSLPRQFRSMPAGASLP